MALKLCCHRTAGTPHPAYYPAALDTTSGGVSVMVLFVVILVSVMVLVVVIVSVIVVVIVGVIDHVLQWDRLIKPTTIPLGVGISHCFSWLLMITHGVCL
jgi:hypothetical protein